MNRDANFKELVNHFGLCAKDCTVQFDVKEEAVVIEWIVKSNASYLTNPPQKVPDRAFRVVLQIEDILNFQTGKVVEKPATREIIYEPIQT
jgi:hypothetical protein